MTDEELRHLCSMASVWAGNVLREDFDPTDLGGESRRNITNCHQILAKAFVGLLNRSPEFKPRFRVRS